MIVLDANVFIHGKVPDFDGEVYTTQRVLDELKSEKAVQSFKLMDVKVENVDLSSRSDVIGCSEKMDYSYSDADLSLVALADSLGARLVTDDRSIRPLCEALGVTVEGFYR